MTAIGMETFLSRPTNRSPSDAERAATANTVGADLMISLRCETQPSPSANGVASFHFGNSHGSVSTIGRNLADFIQREVVARTGLRDCRTHGRTWDLLRLTRMPTVQVDVGYITNPRDRAMLVTTQTRDSIAEGILAAVKRLYLLGKNDRPTGTFTFAELLAHELSVEQAGSAARTVANSESGLQRIPERDPAPTGCCSCALSSSRSSAASTSAFQPSPLSSSRRSRGKYGCGATTVKPTSSRKSASIMHWSNEQSPSASSTGRNSGCTASRFGKLGGRRRAAERLQRPHTAADQFVDHLSDQAVRQLRRRLPGLHAHRRQQHRVRATPARSGNRCARGTARGGA